MITKLLTNELDSCHESLWKVAAKSVNYSQATLRYKLENNKLSFEEILFIIREIKSARLLGYVFDRLRPSELSKNCNNKTMH